MTVEIISKTGSDTRGKMVVKITGVASAAAAGQGSLANPEGVALGILRSYLYARTGSTGAGNLGVGITTIAAKATDVVNDQDVIQGTVGGKLIHEGVVPITKTEVGTAIWTAATYMTFSGSASLVGLDADLIVEYVRLA